MTVTVHRVGAEASDRLAALHGRCFADGWTAASIARLIGGPSGVALIACRDGADAGFALLHAVPPEAELLSVGVDPAARRGGVAKALIRRAAADLIAQGTDTMFLDVAADNGAAIALYRSLGFGDISVRPRYYGGAVDAIMMQAPLASIASEGEQCR